MNKTRYSSKIRLSGSDRTLVIVNGILLTLFFIVQLYPMLYVLSASFSDPTAVTSGRMILWPVNASLDGYKYILQYSEIWQGYANTIYYTVLGTMVNLVITLPAAYALSRRDMVSRGFLMVIFMFTMYFSGGLIPGYLNIKDLGLIDTRLVMLISGGLSVYNLIVARTFFANTIPWELHEAARIDGCNDFKIFLKIVLPLSAPIIVILTIYYGVGHWNSYFNAMIYLKDRDKYPLQLFLREILVQSKFAQEAMSSGESFTAEEMVYLIKQADTANMIKYCVIVASTLPMLAIYPFLQKYFAKGMMIGSVKG